MNHPAQPAPEGAVNYSEFDIPDGVVIGMPWPHTLVTWPGGKSRNATRVEHDLWQIAAKERARCERLEGALKSAVANHQLRCDMAIKIGQQPPTSESWVIAAKAALAQPEDGK